MTRLFTTLLAGTAILGLAGISGANATTISGGSFSLSQTKTDYSQALGTYSLFNTNLGTLQSVTFTYGYGFNSTITVSAQTASTGSVQTESAANFTTANSGIQNVFNADFEPKSALIGSTTLTPAAYDITGDKNGYMQTAGTSQTYVSNAVDQTKTVVETANVTPFSAGGGGTFVVNVATLTGLNVTATGGNATQSQVTSADQSFSIQYNYTAAVVTPPSVPEPASLALLGAGLASVGFFRRRK